MGSDGESLRDTAGVGWWWWWWWGGEFREMNSEQQTVVRNEAGHTGRH